MTELKDLKVGDEVTLTIKGDVIDVAEDCVRIDYGDYDQIWILTHEEVDSGRVVFERITPPLPTEPGVYVPASNRSHSQDSYIYKLNSAYAWIQLRGDGVKEAAEAEARYAHENLGGLVRLVPEQ